MTTITITAIKQAVADAGYQVTRTFGKDIRGGQSISVYRVNLHNGHDAPQTFADPSERECWLKVYRAIVKD